MQTPSQLEYTRQFLNNFKIEYPTMCAREKINYAQLYITFRCIVNNQMTCSEIKKTFLTQDSFINNIATVYVDNVRSLTPYWQLELLAELGDKLYENYKVCNTCVSVTPPFDIFSQ
jgi:hypothetical protein